MKKLNYSSKDVSFDVNNYETGEVVKKVYNLKKFEQFVSEKGKQNEKIYKLIKTKNNRISKYLFI